MSHNAEHYRNRAKELRREAASRDEETARKILMNVADQCDRIADDIEAKEKARPGQPLTKN